MKTFEYKILTTTDADEDDETMLNTYGADGWELINVHVSEVTYIEGGDDEDEEPSGEEYVEEVVTYYLKREKNG
jgi:hypothetical protein